MARINPGTPTIFQPDELFVRRADFFVLILERNCQKTKGLFEFVANGSRLPEKFGHF